MKKNYAATEEKARVLLSSAAQEADVDAIARKARQQYLLREAEKPAKQKKSPWLRALAACALAIGFMVASVVYTVWAPVPLGNADGFLRRVTIWVNEALHLNLDIPVPPVQESTPTGTVYASVQQAAQQLGRPLVALDEEKTGFTLQEVTVEQLAPNVTFVMITYNYKEQKVVFALNDALSSDSIYVEETAEALLSPLGTLTLWKTGEGSRSTGIIADWLMDIKATNMSTEELTDLLLSMQVIN